MIGGSGDFFPAGGGWARRGLASILSLTMLVVCLASVGAPSNAAAASLADGVWMTANGKGAVEIRSCDDRLCGYAAEASQSQSASTAAPDALAGEAKPADGKGRLLTNFSGGPMHWSGGVIRDPRNGRIYTGTLQLIDATTLRITGCLVAPLCASQVWKRIR